MLDINYENDILEIIQRIENLEKEMDELSLSAWYLCCTEPLVG